MKEKQDYEIANEAAEKLFNELKITATISEPFAQVRDDKWPCISYNILFEHEHKSITQEYSLGIGHVDWTECRAGSLHMPGMTQTMENIIYAHQNNKFGGANIKQEYKMDEAKVATWLARRQKVQPKAYEVFATICRDAWEASQETFENWASNLGYDVDSREAEKIYHACREPFGNLIGMLGSKTVKKFAELAQQF